jgi:phosphopantetheine adenylyltransferase
MAATNFTLAGIPTVLVPARTDTRMISSSVVRQLVAGGHLEAAQELVPPCVRPALAALEMSSAGSLTGRDAGAPPALGLREAGE